MYAVIVSGGAQHRVSEGDVLNVQWIDGAEPGSHLEIDRVLLVQDGSNFQIGQPIVEKAKVLATVLEHGREPKIVVFKKKRRKQYRRTQGHRQAFTRLRIDRIVAG